MNCARSPEREHAVLSGRRGARVSFEGAARKARSHQAEIDAKDIQTAAEIRRSRAKAKHEEKAVE